VRHFRPLRTFEGDAFEPRARGPRTLGAESSKRPSHRWLDPRDDGPARRLGSRDSWALEMAAPVMAGSPAWPGLPVPVGSSSPRSAAVGEAGGGWARGTGGGCRWGPEPRVAVGHAGAASWCVTQCEERQNDARKVDIQGVRDAYSDEAPRPVRRRPGRWLRQPGARTVAQPAAAGEDGSLRATGDDSERLPAARSHRAAHSADEGSAWTRRAPGPGAQSAGGQARRDGTGRCPTARRCDMTRRDCCSRRTAGQPPLAARR